MRVRPMFAVLKTGGKQYKVAKNDVIEIERLPGEAGQQVVFDQVLMWATAPRPRPALR